MKWPLIPRNKYPPVFLTNCFWLFGQKQRLVWSCAVWCLLWLIFNDPSEANELSLSLSYFINTHTLPDWNHRAVGWRTDVPACCGCLQLQLGERREIRNKDPVDQSSLTGRNGVEHSQCSSYNIWSHFSHKKYQFIWNPTNKCQMGTLLTEDNQRRTCAKSAPGPSHQWSQESSWPLYGNRE